MAKLILKQQEPPKGSWLSHYGSQIAYAGFITLLLMIFLGILFAFKPNFNTIQPLPTLDSATEPSAKSHYISDWEKLKQMQATYEQLAKDANSHTQASLLLNQAEMAWQHLLIMSESIDQLGLNTSDKKQLEAEQAYLQDQWQARIHFSELRLERFSNAAPQAAALLEDTTKAMNLDVNAVATSTNNDLAQTKAVADVQPSNKYIAQPPADVKLPAGFCTLDNAGICKPEASN